MRTHEKTTLFPWIFYHRWRNRTKFKVRRESSILENIQTSVWCNSAKALTLLFTALSSVFFVFGWPNYISPTVRKALFSLSLYFSVSLKTISVRLAQNHSNGFFFEGFLIFCHIHKGYFFFSPIYPISWCFKYHRKY